MTFGHTEHEFITEIYIFKPEETVECVSNVSTLGKNIFDDTDNNPIEQRNSFQLLQVETSPVFLIAGHVVVKWITCSRTFMHGLKPSNQMHIRCADENIISRYSRPDKN